MLALLAASNNLANLAIQFIVILGIVAVVCVVMKFVEVPQVLVKLATVVLAVGFGIWAIWWIVRLSGVSP